MTEPSRSYAVVVVPPDGDGALAWFETYPEAVAHADRALAGSPSSRAGILRLGVGEIELLGSRGAGHWTYDRGPRYFVAQREGGVSSPYGTDEEAREHAEAAAGRTSSGMVILSAHSDQRITIEDVPRPLGPTAQR
jgi:hypothetical protein